MAIRICKVYVATLMPTHAFKIGMFLCAEQRAFYSATWLEW